MALTTQPNKARVVIPCMNLERGPSSKWEKSAGSKKVDEYVSRIRAGEPREKILADLSQRFQAAIDEKLASEPNQNRSNNVPQIQSSTEIQAFLKTLPRVSVAPAAS
jgi:hypothetical protein